MFSEVQSSFVVLGDGIDPNSIPDHIGPYYDHASEVFRSFGHYKGLDNLHPNVWPLICLLADSEKRIAALEAKLAEGPIKALEEHRQESTKALETELTKQLEEVVESTPPPRPTVRRRIQKAEPVAAEV